MPSSNQPCLYQLSMLQCTSCTIHESIFMLSIIIVGGMGKLWGSAAAAAFMILMLEALRFIGLPGGIAANLRQMPYGTALVIVIWIQNSQPSRGIRETES